MSRLFFVFVLIGEKADIGGGEDDTFNINTGNFVDGSNVEQLTGTDGTPSDDSGQGYAVDIPRSRR